MKIINNDIVVKTATLVGEKNFIKMCTEEEDFKKFIVDAKSLINKKSFVFYYQDNLLGVFWPEITNVSGVILSTPNLYMEKKMSKLTIACIAKMISILFLDFYVDKILFPIYGNNDKVLKIMKNFNLNHEGIFKYGLEIDNNAVDIHYYSLMKKDIKKVNSIYMKKYGY